MLRRSCPSSPPSLLSLQALKNERRCSRQQRLPLRVLPHQWRSHSTLLYPIDSFLLPFISSNTVINLLYFTVIFYSFLHLFVPVLLCLVVPDTTTVILLLAVTAAVLHISSHSELHITDRAFYLSLPARLAYYLPACLLLCSSTLFVCPVLSTSLVFTPFNSNCLFLNSIPLQLPLYVRN